MGLPLWVDFKITPGYDSGRVMKYGKGRFNLKGKK